MWKRAPPMHSTLKEPTVPIKRCRITVLLDYFF